MSYASAAINNILPFSEQPHPEYSQDGGDDAPKSNGDQPKKSSKHLREVEAEGLYLWQIAKHYLTRPAISGGLFGIVNFGLLAFAGRKFYWYPRLRRDANTISASFLACIFLIATGGYVATHYRQALRDQEEERKVNKGGTVSIFRQFDERIGSLGGIVCLVNTVVLGTVGYWSYLNWNKPWDRRAISAMSVGLLALLSGEGFLAKRHRK